MVTVLRDLHCSHCSSPAPLHPAIDGLSNGDSQGSINGRLGSFTTAISDSTQQQTLPNHGRLFTQAWTHNASQTCIRMPQTSGINPANHSITPCPLVQ